MATSKFNFYPMGIGQLLRQGRLEVPPNQRSYAWREKQVTYLLQDLNDAISDPGSEDYFLGTIVLIQSPNSIPAIVDGQQRLATTAILLARIRDYFLSMGREGSARAIEEAFLSHIDVDSEAPLSRIKMNDEDNTYFNDVILPRQPITGPVKSGAPTETRRSNRRMLRASELARKYIAELLKVHPKERHADLLVRWHHYIDTRASILALYVPDEFSAFRMFETLNDRGLRASQADILKNYFYSKAPKSLSEAKSLWESISVTIDPLGGDQIDDDDDSDDEERRVDPLVTFLRHLWVTTHGVTKQKDLAEKIRGEVTNETRAMRFLTSAQRAAPDYVAISDSRHYKWRDYRPSTRQYVDVISRHLQVAQIRPLLFAVAHHFTPDEADKAFKLFVSWSVRFLIAGGRGGMLDTQYSNRAMEVGTGKATKARELRSAMKKYVPTDVEFEEAFATARITRMRLARYYLRAMEKHEKELPHPEYVANEEVSDVNLEHVMPVNPAKGWGVSPDDAEVAQRLIGNMALLASDKNKDLGNKLFDEKRPVLRDSGYNLTREIAEYPKWDMDAIRDRQRRLARIAVATWPLDLAD